MGQSGNGSSEAGRSGGGSGRRALSRAKTFVQQRLPRPSLAPQGREDDGGEGGGSGGVEDVLGGEDLEAGSRALTTAVRLSRSWSFDHLPRPWNASPQGEEKSEGNGNGNGKGRASNLGPLPRPATLAEKFPRPRQIISQGAAMKGGEGTKAGEGEKEGEGRREGEGEGEGDGDGERTVRARSLAEELLPGAGIAPALRDNGNGDDGGVGEGKAVAANRGPVPVTKARSLMDRLPRPKQVLQGKSDAKVGGFFCSHVLV